MANEFVIKNGFISNGNGFINNNLWVSGNTNLNLLTASTVNLSTTPTNNNSATQVLVRNTSTGNIEYRDSSSISSSAVTDTYVTGFTYTSSANTLTIKQNNGQSDLNVLINAFSALTVNDLSVSNNLSVSGTVYFSGTSNLTTVTAETISNVDYIDFNNTYTGATIVEGRMFWDEPNGTVSLGMHGGLVSQQIGLEYYYYVKNQSGSTIENGRVVRAAGTLGASGKILGEYMIADGSIPAKYTLGIATEDIINGDDGYVTEFGLVRGINTTGALYGETWVDGDILYVSPTISGGLTKFEPQAPYLKIEMAIVVYANANGSLFVRPHRYPSLNDIQNASVTGATEGDLLIFNNSTDNIWVNSKVLNGSYTITGNTTIGLGLTANTVSATTLSATSIVLSSANGFKMDGPTTAGYVLTTDINGNGTWQAGGGPTLINVSSTDTFTTANETINCTSGTFIVNLPTAVGIQGTTYTLVNSGAGIITMKGTLGQTINGSLTIDLAQYISRTVQSDGTNWIII